MTAEIEDAMEMEEDPVEEQEVDDDDDEALREALACGKLKPGLYGQFAELKTQGGKLDKEGLDNALQAIKLKLGWIERLDIVGGLAPLTRAAYEAVGVDFDQSAVQELEKLDADLHVEGDAESSDDEEDNDGKPKRKGKSKRRRAERAVVNNDFAREMHFYRQAQAASVVALQRLHEAGVPTRRPGDYLAEMAKSDTHMQRVRDRLLQLENRLALADKAKRIRDARKFAKEAERERAAESKASSRRLDALVDSVRSGKRTTADLERELATETSRAKQLAGARKDASKRPNRPAAKADQGRRPADKQKSAPRNRKRERKNEQYGFGGQKKRAKWNTRESNEDVDRSFARWKASGPSKFKGKGKAGPKGSGQRPGKRTRQRIRNKNA